MHYGEKLMIRNAVWSETENKKDPKFRGGRGYDKMHGETLPKERLHDFREDFMVGSYR
jgi:hypothetical protein